MVSVSKKTALTLASKPYQNAGFANVVDIELYRRYIKERSFSSSVRSNPYDQSAPDTMFKAARKRWQLHVYNKH